MPAFSEDQVVALAPDESSLKSGRDLANARKWVSFGASDKGVWGECQGSGSNPYQTCIDTNQLAFKCSCPSRKFPCKHGLGLLLLYSRGPATFVQNVPPDWVEKWFQSRGERQEKKAKKLEEGAESAPDPVAKAKRQADRQAKVDAGISEFRLWMQDRIRQGLAGLEQQSYQFWEGPAARLTDAQAPGLARQVRQCAGIPNTGQGWQERLLERMSLLHLAAEGYTRITELPEDVQQDLRTVIGFTVSQDDVLRQTGIKDRFQVLGQRTEQEDRLKVQRTWLRGETTKQWALVLNFAHGMQPLDISLVPGSVFEAELVFFPGAVKQRALVKSRGDAAELISSFIAYKNADEFLADYAANLAANPWMETFPVAIENVRATRLINGKFSLVDADDFVLPLGIPDGVGWQIMALTGGHHFSIFAEWNGELLLPLSVVSGGAFYRVDQKVLANAE